MNLEKPNNSQPTNNNDYYAPPETMDDYYDDDDYYEENDSTWYHLSGRIGRLRYLTYYMFATFLLGIIMGLSVVFVLFIGNDNILTNIFSIIVSIFYLAYFIYVVFIYTIRRLNDLDKTGWLCLLMFIPIVNIIFYLYLMLVRGTEGVNDYGNPPRPNKAIHYIGGLFPFFIAILGILMAIALPAYQDYVKRAEQVRIEMQE